MKSSKQEVVSYLSLKIDDCGLYFILFVKCEVRSRGNISGIEIGSATIVAN